MSSGDVERVDGEKVASPMLETARRLGIRTICLHKGVPLGGSAEQAWHPRDLERAACDFPDLNRIADHSALRSLGSGLDASRDARARVS